VQLTLPAFDSKVQRHLQSRLGVEGSNQYPVVRWRGVGEPSHAFEHKLDMYFPVSDVSKVDSTHWLGIGDSVWGAENPHDSWAKIAANTGSLCDQRPEDDPKTKPVGRGLHNRIGGEDAG